MTVFSKNLVDKIENDPQEMIKIQENKIKFEI